MATKCIGKLRVGFLAVLILLAFSMEGAVAADPIVGQWNYATSNHWSKGPVPAGRPSTGVLVIEPDGNQYKMTFQSGMVFNPPELKHFSGVKNGDEYVFSNSAQVDNEGGVAKNTCNMTAAGEDQFAGKSSSQYSNGAVTFHWGFDIVLTR